MRLLRRQFLRLAAGAAVFPAAPHIATAQTYPARPVRIIVGFPPAGAADIIARLIGEWLSERLGQPFIIENRPGAGGNIGAEAVVRAPPDGHTLLLVATPNAVNATLYDKLNFDFIHNIAPVAGLDRAPYVVEVNPAVPARTVPEFIAYAKANPGKINYASAGNGSLQHVAGELFKMMAGINMLHVPYRGGGPAITDLIGGQVQFMIDVTTSSIEYIRVGTLRGLAVTTRSRSEALPDLPPVGDFVPGYEVSGWAGIGAPKNTPIEIITRLNKEINAGLADEKMIGRFSALGIAPMPMTPADFGNFIAAETEKFAKVIRAANIKAE